MNKLLCFALLLSLSSGLAMANGGTSAAAILGLPELQKSSPAELIAYLSDKRFMYRSVAAKEIASRKIAAASTALKKLLSDEVPAIRVDAAKALLAIGDRSGLVVLKALLVDKSVSSDTALHAATVLKSAGDDTGLALINSALKSKDRYARMDAIRSINSDKDDESAYLVLEAGLKDTSSDVRLCCLLLLGKRSTLRSLELIKPLLSWECCDDRSMALCAVSRTHLWGGIPMLIGCLTDSDSSIRDLSASALKYLTGHPLSSPSRILDDNAAADLQKEWQKWWDANSGLHPMDYKIPMPKELEQSVTQQK